MQLKIVEIIEYADRLYKCTLINQIQYNCNHQSKWVWFSLRLLSLHRQKPFQPLITNPIKIISTDCNYYIHVSKFVSFSFILETKCTDLSFADVADCNHTSVNYTGYKEFIELDKLKDSRPVGYLANVTVFIIGPKDAHVLFSTSDKITIYDNVYEIGIVSMKYFVSLSLFSYKFQWLGLIIILVQ